MNVAIEIAFSFKHALGDDYHKLELPECATVHDALAYLGKRYDVFHERVFNEIGEIRRNINALVNGVNVQFREGFDTILTDGDRLTVLPPVGGG